MRPGAGSAAAASALLGAALFFPTVRYDYTFDDLPQIRDNRALRAGDGWKRVFTQGWWGLEQKDGLYRPLPQLTFWAQVAGGDGREPPPASRLHLMNALLHGAVAGLVALVAARLTGRGGAGLAAGALFAAHPLHVEAVSGLVGRAELLASLFVLGALLLRGRPGPAARAGESFLFLLALLSKESAATYGLLAALWDRVVLGRTPGRSLRALAGPAAVFALYLVLHRLATGSWLWPQPSQWWGGRVVAWLGTGLNVLGRYALLVVAPVTLSADYSFDQIPVPRSLLEARVLLPSIALLALAVGAVALLRRRRLPEVGFGVLFFFLAFAATANVLFPTGTPMGERLAYLPSVGPCLAATAALRWGRGGAVVLALATLALGARTAARLPDWKDDLTMFRKTVETSPRSHRSWLKLASVQLARKEYAEAEANYGRALAILPTASEAWNDLGFLYEETGRPERALDAFAEAVRVLPRSFEGHYNLGSFLLRMGRPREAIPHLEEAARLRPDRLQAGNNLGVAWMKLKDFERARACFDRVLAADPRNGTALMNRAVLHLLDGRAAEAIALCDRALAEASERSTRHFWRDYAEAMRRGLPWAGVDVVRAIRDGGGNPPADLYLRLAELCRSADYAHPERARAYLQTWLSMSPGHPDAARVRAELERGGVK
jgi:tetratricopeptide (TPR) repeat protein